MARVLSLKAGQAASALILLLILGCSKPDNTCRAERLCRSYLERSLLNPETAQFIDFRSISQQDYVQGLMGFADESQFLPGGLPPSIRTKAEALTREFARDLAARDADFYTLRVRAQARVGNVVTAPQYCASTEDECICLSAETYRQFLRG